MRKSIIGLLNKVNSSNSVVLADLYYDDKVLINLIDEVNKFLHTDIEHHPCNLIGISSLLHFWGPSTYKNLKIEIKNDDLNSPTYLKNMSSFHSINFLFDIIS